MASTVLSVRIPEQLKEQLDYLSRSTKRSKAYLAAEALGDYVKKNAWRAKELHEANQRGRQARLRVARGDGRLGRLTRH